MKAPRWIALALVAAAAASAPAQEQTKWSSLDAGVQAAKRSGRPILLLTMWKRGVDLTCDTWRDRVPVHPEVARQMWRFEKTEWLYDGLSGKVIPWTREHGGTNEDPTIQAFVILPDSGQVTRAAPKQALTPDAFAKWLKDQADSWEKIHPVPKLGYVAGEMRTEGEGTGKKWFCRTVESALKEDRCALVFITRGEKRDADKTAKTQAAESKKIEKGFLESEFFARVYQGWSLVKVDISDADGLAWAKSWGVEKAPYYLEFFPGATKPEEIDPSKFPGGPGAGWKGGGAGGGGKGGGK